jgi:hypothetical protein
MEWNYLRILHNVLGSQQGCHIDILQSDGTTDQDNRSTKTGLLLCLPKNTNGTGELQLVTVLNRDYELPVRILANRMRQTVNSGVPQSVLWDVKQNHVRCDSGYP